MKLRHVLLMATLFAVTVRAYQAPPQGQQGPPPLPTGTAVISGKVVADNGKPIRGASVIAADSSWYGGPQKRAVTDVDGKYMLSALGTGKYRLTASADHFLGMQFGQSQPGPVGLNNQARPVEIQDGEKFDTADFTLSRMSAIEGFVVDEFGDPVPNVSIQVSQVQFAGGRRRLFPTSLSGGSGPQLSTNDRGQFRVFGLAPGDYYVTALSGAFADPNAAGGFGVTFYPGTTSASAAQSVKVLAGHDVTDVRFSLVPAPMARVSGTVMDAAGKALGKSGLMLMPSERSGASLFMIVRATSSDDGTFVFRNVPPGRYTIQAFGTSISGDGNLGSYTFGYLTFDVGETDLDTLRVRIPPPRSIRGTIKFEGGGSPPVPDDVHMQALPVEFESGPVGGGPSPYKTNDDWTFEIKAMSGVRMLLVNAQGWFLQRITRAGIDITNSPLDLREIDVNDLEVVLTTHTTTITGSVSLADGTPVSDYSVVVFSADESKWTPWSRFVQQARPDQRGAFTIKGIPPGNYLAVPFTSLPNGGWQDPEILKSLRDGAATFSLLDGGTQTLTLKMKRPSAPGATSPH